MQPSFDVMKEVLLFCPTYMDGSEPWIRPETRAGIERTGARHPEIEVMISTNNPYPVGMENVLYQYQLARKIVLERDYRALLTYEHDMLAPDDGFEKLDEIQAPVVYGLYLLRHGTPVVNAFRDVASVNVGMSLSHFPDELKLARRKIVVPVSGAGFGFTLMRREVLEAIEFRRSNGGRPIPDLPFSEDCIRNGFRQVCRFDVECGHFNKGRWLWPGEDVMMGEMCNVVVMQDFVGSVGGQTVRYVKGMKVKMPEREALEYERAGYVQVMRPVEVKLAKAPEVEVVKRQGRRRTKATK